MTWTCEETKQSLNYARNETVHRRKLIKLLKEEENKKLDYQLQEIERFKDDSNKYYQAIRKWKARKPKKPLQIYDEKFNLVTAEDGRCQIITNILNNFSPQMTRQR